MPTNRNAFEHNRADLEMINTLIRIVYRQVAGDAATKAEVEMYLPTVESYVREAFETIKPDPNCQMTKLSLGPWAKFAESNMPAVQDNPEHLVLIGEHARLEFCGPKCLLRWLAYQLNCEAVENQDIRDFQLGKLRSN